MSSPVAADPDLETPDRDPRSRSRWPDLAHRLYFRWLTPAAVVLGAVLRTREWLHDKSLWLDEIGIAMYLVQRNYRQLLEPMGDQGAPVGWLWAERASISIFGQHELAFRLIPWLTSLVAVAIFPLVATRLVGPIAAPIATVLIATSPALIYYAAETKQYSSDVMCALLVLLVTSYTAGRTLSYRSCLLWGVACGALAWCSQPSILIAAGCGLWLLAYRARNRRSLLPILAGGGLLALALAAEWLVSLRQLAANDGLARYWQKFGGYPPDGAGLGDDPRWLGAAITAVQRQIGHFAVPLLASGLALWGLATLYRRRRWTGVLVTVLALIAIAAAVTRHYPLAQRLALYLLPIIVLLLVAGLDELSATGRHPLPRPWRYVTAAGTAIAVVVCCLPAVLTGVGKLLDPDDSTSGRQALEFVAARRDPSDVVLTDRWALNTFSFYGPQLHVTRDGLVSIEPGPRSGCPTDPLAPLRTADRVWLVLAHHPSNEPLDRDDVYASQLAAHGTLIASYRGAGDAAAHLFDLRHPPQPPARPLPVWIRGGCFTITVTDP